MFTGIVEEIGVIKDIRHQKNLAVLKVQAKKIIKGTKIGDSIAINGVCLTVTSIKAGVLTFDVMLETLDKTTLGLLKAKTKVNLERALKLGDRFSGHIVSGHVDTVERVKEIIVGKNYTEFRISLLKSIKKFVVEKGSICIDGVSLTVGKVRTGWFSVYLIPHTKRVTTLGLKKQKDKVNIEIDILAKYVLNSDH